MMDKYDTNEDEFESRGQNYTKKPFITQRAKLVKHVGGLLATTADDKELQVSHKRSKRKIIVDKIPNYLISCRRKMFIWIFMIYNGNQVNIIKVDTTLNQLVTSVVIYHDTTDPTSDIVDEKALCSIESAADVYIDGEYYTDNDYEPFCAGNRSPFLFICHVFFVFLCDKLTNVENMKNSDGILFDEES